MKIQIMLTFINRDETKGILKYSWDTDEKGEFSIQPLERQEGAGVDDPRFITLSLEALPE